jgi:hypothetical protein
MTASRKNGAKTGADGRFKAGNPGKPKGARHKTTLAVEALLEGEAEKLTRKVIDLALGGDAAALRLCMERIAPVRRGRTVNVDLPLVETAEDVANALGALIAQVAAGEVTPDEAVSIGSLLENRRKTIETAEIVARIEALEAKG